MHTDTSANPYIDGQPEAATVSAAGSQKRRGRIRARIALYFLLAGSSILILGLVLTNMFGVQTVRQTIGTNFQELARVAANRVEALLEAELRHLNDLARNPQIRSGIAMAESFYSNVSKSWVQAHLAEREISWQQGISEEDIEVLENDIAEYLATIVGMQKDTVIGISIVDEKGALLAASSRPLHFDLRLTPWWQAVKEKHGPFISDFLDKGTTFPALGDVLEIAVPIMRIGRFAGAVHISLKAKPLLAVVDEIHIGETGHAMLVDDLGMPLICKYMSPERHRFDQLLMAAVTAPEAGWSVISDDGHGGTDSIIGFAPVRMAERFGVGFGDGRRWFTYIQQSPDETYAGLSSLLWKVGWVGTLLVISLAMAGMYAGWRIERPIRALQKGAGIIGGGDFQHRIHIDTGDEIGELAQAFNKMASNIGHTQEKLANFANAVNHAGDAIIITNVDGVIFYINPAFEELTGFSAEEVIGKTPRLWNSGKNPQTTYKQMWDTINSGSVWAGELINRKKDGSLFTAQMTVSPILNERGEVVNLLGLQRDVTVQRAMEGELRRHHDELEQLVEERAREIKLAKEELEELLENANDIIFTLDAGGFFHYVNPRVNGWGYTPAHLVGQHFSSILAQKGETCRQECISLCREGLLYEGRLQEADTNEFCIATADGKRRDVMISVSSLETGKVLVIARDMTDIKQLQRQVTEAEKMRAIGEVATMLAHDFRNPLSTIKMNLQILSRRMQPGIATERRRDAVENREHFDLALTEVGFLEHLLTSMLEFARPANMAMAWEDAGLLLADICRPFTTSLDGKRIDFVQHLDESPVEIHVDREKLKQVLNNLLSNAAKAMPKGGNLGVSTQAEERDGETWLVIEISDTGCGMSAELQQRIFDPFFTSHSDGTGLGLAIVNKIIEAHRGEIAVVSEPGKGSTFTIAVPARQPSGVKDVVVEKIEFVPRVQG